MTFKLLRLTPALVLTIAAGATTIVLAQGMSQTMGMGPKTAKDPKMIHQPTDAMRALGIYQAWSDADIDFMTGMIPHHAQAIIMDGWAPTHGARKDVAILCERIVVGQGDEIKTMQTWLRDHALPVPDAKDTRMHMKMPNGQEMATLMPGMLSDEEMAALDKARGSEYDRLFLVGMIKHHQGAIDMVNDLFASYGAAQDDKIYKFASDVFADQSVEIERMNEMLATVGKH
jgi:uncharacterized protein (DUF305 family)